MCDVNISNHQLQLIGHDCEYHHVEADMETISYLLKMSPQKNMYFCLFYQCSYLVFTSLLRTDGKKN